MDVILQKNWYVSILVLCDNIYLLYSDVGSTDCVGMFHCIAHAFLMGISMQIVVYILLPRNHLFFVSQ